MGHRLCSPSPVHLVPWQEAPCLHALFTAVLVAGTLSFRAAYLHLPAVWTGHRAHQHHFTLACSSCKTSCLLASPSAHTVQGCQEPRKPLRSLDTSQVLHSSWHTATPTTAAATTAARIRFLWFELAAGSVNPLNSLEQIYLGLDLQVNLNYELVVLQCSWWQDGKRSVQAKISVSDVQP